MRADRIVGRARRPKLAFFREGQLRDVGEAARRPLRVESCPAQLHAVERGAVEEVGELDAIARVVDGELLCPRKRLDLGREHDQSPPSDGCSYPMAPSALAASRKP